MSRQTADAVPSSIATSATRRGVVLTFLALAYAHNVIDRSIISVVGQAIKDDLQLSDTQLGALSGLAFAVLYTALGLPIARLSERFSRVNIITASIAIWSVFSAMCGLAASFTQLLIARAGVGVGEAGLAPPAHSMISDLYPTDRRTTALAIFGLGAPLGSIVGAAAGGWLTQTFSWRVAMICAGLPGLALAVAMKMMVRDPRPLVTRDAAQPASRISLRGELAEIGAVARILLMQRATLNVVIGATLASVATYGISTFTAPFLIRNFDLDFTRVGLVVGLVLGGSSALGMFLGGFLSDRFARRHARWYAMVPGIGLLLAAPLYYLGFSQGFWQATAIALFLPGLVHFTYIGPTFGIVQNMVGNRQRATATAVLMFLLNLVALGGGPLLTGWLIDALSAHRFGAGFHSMCTTDVAGTLAARCVEASTSGTRLGLIITAGVCLWAGLHFLFAATTLGASLERAKAAQESGGGGNA